MALTGLEAGRSVLGNFLFPGDGKIRLENFLLPGEAVAGLEAGRSVLKIYCSQERRSPGWRREDLFVGDDPSRLKEEKRIPKGARLQK